MPFCLGLRPSGVPPLPLPSVLWVWERQIQRMGTGYQADEREQSGGFPCTNASGMITDWAKVTSLLGGDGREGAFWKHLARHMSAWELPVSSPGSSGIHLDARAGIS